jgi:hypothetical protein
MMLITTKMSSEKYINSASLSESILRLDFINSNTYFMLHLSKIFKIKKFRIFTKKLGLFYDFEALIRNIRAAVKK